MNKQPAFILLRQPAVIISLIFFICDLFIWYQIDFDPWFPLIILPGAAFTGCGTALLIILACLAKECRRLCMQCALSLCALLLFPLLLLSNTIVCILPTDAMAGRVIPFWGGIAFCAHGIISVILIGIAYLIQSKRDYKI